MIEQAPSAEFARKSLAYGEHVADSAAITLRRNVDELAATAGTELAVEIKTDLRGAQSPVTAYDQETERLIGSMYADSGVRVKGEEEVNSWPEDETPILDVHVDPIDGTGLFVDYVRGLLTHEQTPVVCGSMVSIGASRPGEDKPLWGVVAAPFVAPEGIIRWSASADRPAQRLEPGSAGAVPLPHASELEVPHSGGVVIVTSDSSERAFRAPLEKAGYRVIKYESAVAAALSVIDPTLFERLRPDELGDDIIIGSVMGTAKNWDVAGTMAIAHECGHFVSDIHGDSRDLRDGQRSAIFATREEIGKHLAEIVSPHAY